MSDDARLRHRRVYEFSLRTVAVAGVILAMGATPLSWGARAHELINRVAVRTIPPDGPVFLKAHEDWVAYLASIPDTWRRPSEPFLKILEDPNHGWFREQFAFMQKIPRSRYEFVLRLYDEQRRLPAGDPARVLTNVRWTGTLPFAAVEGYERMLTAMRRYRAGPEAGDRTHVEREIAFYMGWTGHYTGDGAQPLHDTIHHDGWQGANPNDYTTDPRVHGRFESQFVDAMKLAAEDFQPNVAPARVLRDPFTAILEHLDTAATHVEEVYQLDKSGALADATQARARALVIERVASGAALLRDLAYTAWIHSAEPPVADPAGNPVVPAHPRYNPSTGSAPAHRADAPRPPQVRSDHNPSAGPRWPHVSFVDPVIGKNFYLLEAIANTPAVRALLARHPASAAVRDAGVKKLAHAAATCGADITCHADAYAWSTAETQEARTVLQRLAAEPVMKAFVDDTLRPSGMFVRHASTPNAELLALAWSDAIAGLNRIVDVYARGTAPRYPKSDAVSYDVTAESYRRLIGIITDVVYERRDRIELFFDPSLQFARRLLEVNRRDEAGRHEPLHLGENRATVTRLASIDWAAFPYAAILVPGAGPDRPDVRLDPWARLRLELAVERYRAGKAPLIIVSGGYVHPAQTPYAEALEMKRALVREFAVPEDVILVDPHARHTTTNFRNAVRLMLRSGVPPEKPSLVTTDRYQSRYIDSKEFKDRCTRELGYQPATITVRLSPFDLEFLMNAESLHADARDPLDP